MLKTLMVRGLTVVGLFLATAVHGAPVTFELEGAAMDLSVPGFPLTTAEVQELVRMFTGQARLTLVYDAATTPENGHFHYNRGSGAVFVLTVTNATGTRVFSFDEYRIFLDDQPHLDVMVFTPFLATDASVTLSTGTVVQIDIGLILQDATGTSLTSSSAPPATLDFTKLNIRGYKFLFIMPDGLENGRGDGCAGAGAPRGRRGRRRRPGRHRQLPDHGEPGPGGHRQRRHRRRLRSAGGTLKVPSTVRFGNVSLGSSKTQVLVISNSSRTQSLVVRVNPPSPNPPFSLVSGGGTMTIGPRDRLRFTPTATGQATGSLVI